MHALYHRAVCGAHESRKSRWRGAAGAGEGTVADATGTFEWTSRRVPEELCWAGGSVGKSGLNSATAR